MHCRRRRGELLTVLSVTLKSALEKLTDLVWALSWYRVFFCGHARSPHVVMQGNLAAAQYRDRVLQPVLPPFMQKDMVLD